MTHDGAVLVKDTAPRDDEAASMDAELDALVVGAGVVGLACGAALAEAGLSVAIVDRCSAAGGETSTRNSGVIHAGLYYPHGSLKALTCIEGRERLYAFCAARRVPHRKTGKLIVATSESERAPLLELFRRGEANGVEGLELLDQTELRGIEPHLRAVAAIRSHETGLVDPHALVEALRHDAIRHGAMLVLGTELVGLVPTASGWLADTLTGDERARIRAPRVVNAAGLYADRIARLASVDTGALDWNLSFWKGDYYSLSPSAPSPSTELVYPLPSRGGLGIHLTRTLEGRWIAGPDAAPIDSVDYAVDDALAPDFADCIARYLPGIGSEHLTPDYRGIRAKRRADGGFADFVLDERPAGLVHLLGIESPGLTACLALAERVRSLCA